MSNSTDHLVSVFARFAFVVVVVVDMIAELGYGRRGDFNQSDRQSLDRTIHAQNMTQACSTSLELWDVLQDHQLHSKNFGDRAAVSIGAAPT